MYLGWKLNNMSPSLNAYFSKDMYGGLIILFISFPEENVLLNFIVVAIDSSRQNSSPQSPFVIEI